MCAAGSRDREGADLDPHKTTQRKVRRARSHLDFLSSEYLAVIIDVRGRSDDLSDEHATVLRSSRRGLDTTSCLVALE